MGIATEVWRAVTYDGRSGCTHDVLLQAVRPSASNADQGALDAGEAFADAALDHLQTWFEQWRLPLLCVDLHTSGVVGRSEEPALLDVPGFGQVELWRSVNEAGWMTLSTESFVGAEPVSSYLLRSRGD